MLGGFALEYWVSVIDYPLNIGGRPFASWPDFVIPAYETTILCASITAVVGMITLNGLPQPYHPVFNAPNFSNASADRFFLVRRDGRSEVRRGRARDSFSRACTRSE